jgi:hypothetical protein
MMLRALVESSARFSDLPPIGYEEKNIKWVLDIDSSTGRVDLLGYDKDTLRKLVPTRGDRSGTVSEDNLKPALFVDRASYVFGLRDKGEIDTDTREHKGFLELLNAASLETGEQEAAELLQFLRDQWTAVPGSSEPESLTRLRKRVRGEMKPKDLIALRSGGQVFPFEQPSAHSFWVNYLEKAYCEGMGFCAICGAWRSLVTIRVA